MHKDFDLEFDTLEYQNIEICRYTMYLNNEDHSSNMDEKDPLDMNWVHDQDVMEMNEYNQLKSNIEEDSVAMDEQHRQIVKNLVDIRSMLKNSLDK